MSFDEIFNPGLRHWREFQELQATKILIAPAPGPGPVRVDLDHEVVYVAPGVYRVQDPADDAEANTEQPSQTPPPPDGGVGP
jgi:hypothetical protein